MSRRLGLLALAAAVALLAAAPATAQTVYLAFGDSITEGAFDESAEPGYPPALEDLLTSRGVNAIVENRGLSGESTGEALSRIDSVLPGGDVLLLMEGTNDVNQNVPLTTIIFNLDQLASIAEAAGLGAVHATIIPRRPTATTDGNNRTTRNVNGDIRALAWESGRSLVDPFDLFMSTANVYDRYYVGGDDNLHLDEEGYDFLATPFADVLTGVDNRPPVTGRVIPFDDQQMTPDDTPILIELFDFGAGIEVGATQLLIDDQPVEATISGDERRQQIRYDPPTPWSGVVFVGLEARDREVPANEISGTLLQFVVDGAQFLPGDISRDGRVAGDDLIALALAFGSERGDGRYRTFADLNEDEQVDGADLAILASNFGRSSL
ncbi:MAG TPA: GDSL-type esterase/lipase family protein [Thermoanaerobaculia bacterium]|nr:GDSL-type esterase/lipase family protein [Thermoanaerobaculia bacterium]